MNITDRNDAALAEGTTAEMWADLQTDWGIGYAGAPLARCSGIVSVQAGDVWNGRAVTESTFHPDYLDIAVLDEHTTSQSRFHVQALVAPSAELSDDTWVERGCEVLEDVRTIGRVRLGVRCGIERNVVLCNAELRDGAYVREYCQIGGVDADGTAPGDEGCVIGRESMIRAEVVIVDGSRIGPRNLMYDQAVLRGVTTGQDVTIGQGALVRHVTIPEFAFIRTGADIRGPEDLFTICVADEERLRPTVIAYRTRVTGIDGEPRHAARISIHSEDRMCEFDPCNEETLSEQLHHMRTQYNPRRFRDSEDGAQQGIASILESPERLQALRQRTEAWSRS